MQRGLKSKFAVEQYKEERKKLRTTFIESKIAQLNREMADGKANLRRLGRLEETIEDGKLI